MISQDNVYVLRVLYRIRVNDAVDSVRNDVKLEIRSFVKTRVTFRVLICCVYWLWAWHCRKVKSTKWLETQTEPQ